MAFSVIRLRNIIKRIHVLSAVEIDLAKTKTFIEGKLVLKQTERRRLDKEVDEEKISAKKWVISTDIVDELIAINQSVIEDLEERIADAECQRHELERELETYEDDDITRAMEAVGVWE